MEASGGVDNTRTGLGGADNNRTGLAMEAEAGAEMAGSESRADVAPKDELVGTVAAVDDDLTPRLEELRIKASLAKQIDGGLAWRAGSGAGVAYSGMVQHSLTTCIRSC